MSHGMRPPPDQNKEAPETLAPLDDPLEFMLLQQMRQRTLCLIMRKAAANRVISAALAACIVKMLTQESVLHQSDEDFDLFPALLRRGTAEDALDDLIDDLKVDGARLRRVEPQLIQMLSPSHGNGTIHISRRDATMMLSYALGQQRRLAVEHGILMAIARRRLTTRDLEMMSKSMKKRRGIDPV